MLQPTSGISDVRTRVDREGLHLDRNDGCFLDSLPPERRALFATLIRLAFRGRTAQFLLVGLGRMKGRRWQWTVQPAREGNQIVGADLSCVELPRSRPGAPHFASCGAAPPCPAEGTMH